MEYYDPRDYDLAGRIAKLKTNHGIIETPYLFPVVDPARQEVPLNILLEIGFNAFITNAYLYYKRKRGVPTNIHEFFKWNNPIMTDSGGYQILVYGSVDIDNKTIVTYEKEIGTDIAVILDIPTGTQMSWDKAYSAVKETHRRAIEALPLIMDSNQLWVYPVQGAPYPELVKYASTIGSKLPYHIYALGSPTVYLERYSYENILELATIARMRLPPNKPFHVFGVGHPMIIPFLVAIGADLFDSASYILYARDERLIFEWGTRRLDELAYLPCNCPVCSRYSVKELYELPKSERIRLIAIHNLYALAEELKRTKEAIREGRLWEYLYQKSKLHPSLRKAYNVLSKYIDYLAKFNPETKTPTQALLLIDKELAINPRLSSIRSKTLKLLKSKIRGRIILVPAIEKPFTQQELYNNIKRKYRDHDFLFYNPYLGVFPPELSNTYPYFQHEIGVYEFNEKIFEEVVNRIDELIQQISEVIVVTTEKPGFKEFSERLILYFKNKNVKTTIIRA
ncbi:MAG: tRNA guanosine(15) transglycosylase TgtA [Thermoprotei archaeon]